MDKTQRFKSIFTAGVLALAAASASAGQLTFFERPTFQGSYAATNFAIPDLQSTGYRDTASSIIVNDGVWEACTAVNYGGTCAQLVPGSYATVSKALNGRVASVRQVAYSTSPAMIVITPDARPAVVTGTAPAVVSAPAVVNAPVVPGTVVVANPPVAPMPVGRVVLYQNQNFTGSSAVVDHSRVPDLDWAHFNYPAASLRIQSGTWVACSDMGYRGDCKILEPGDYPNLMGFLSGGVSSLQQVFRAS